MVSPRKSSSALNSIPEEKSNMNPATSKSCESLYSNSSKGSAHIIYRNKSSVVNKKSGGLRGARQPTIIPATNEIRQRVLSARRLRMKTYQNQLADAQQTIAELAHENRILRTLHKRQDSALSKYESTNAELPQLLHSHAEELRVWQTKYRNLQAVNKELEQKIKQKEAVIISLSDQNKYFMQLNKDKNLEERQRLTEKLHILETRVQEKENDIKMMARKMQLQAKQFKQQLQTEHKRNREILMKLEKARLELSGYRKLEELQLQDKFNMNSRRLKCSNNESPKEEKELEKYSLRHVTEAEVADEIEAPNSQRSTQSSDNTVHRTTRSIKNSTTKNHSTISSTTAVIQPISKQQTALNKSITVLKRIDHGDGDASNVNDSFSKSLMQKRPSNLSTTIQIPKENFDPDCGDVDYENVNLDDLEEKKESEENLADNQNDFNDENEECASNIDGSNDGTESIEDIDDYYKDYNPAKNNRMKEEISNIRKQISDDYKEREAFLDNFCRQATNGVLRDETPKKRNGPAFQRNVSGNRKNKLLAALKAIDDNKSG